MWGTATVLFVLVAIYDGTGQAGDAALGALVFAAFTGILALGGVVYVKQLDRLRALPRLGSAAHEPMRRLTEAESVIAHLLEEFADERLPPGWVDRTRYAVANTSHQLRALGAQLQRAERALERAEWRWERVALSEELLDSHDRLTRALDGYDRLIAALGQAVADSPATRSLDALTEAAEHLAALAEALRELGNQDR